MNGTSRRTLGYLLFAIALVVFILYQKGHFASFLGQPKPKVYSISQMPAWELYDLKGHRVRSEDFKDRVLLIHFWAPWCTICRNETAFLKALHRQYADKPFSLVSIVFDETDIENVQAFVDANHIPYTVLKGTGEVIEAFGNIQAIPATFIIGKRGAVVETILGNISEETLQSTLNAELNNV